MRRTGIQRALWLALTALLILSGAVMPSATVWLQDTYAGERAERRPFEAVRLSLRQELETGQVLRLLSGEVDSGSGGVVWINWQSDTHLTKGGAEKAVMSGIGQMMEEDMMHGLQGNWQLSCLADPYLVVSDSAKELSAIIWIVYWEMLPEEEGELPGPMAAAGSTVNGSMYIDDATGRMVGMTFPVSNYWKKLSLWERAELAADFLERYYGMEVQGVEANSLDVQAVNLEDEFLHCFIRFDMGELGQCDVPLMQDRTWLYFNA